MYTRNFYLDKIKPFIKKPVIKVITGMRRVGKSYFLKQIINLLRQQGVPENNILYIDKEQMDFDFIQDYHHLDNYVSDQFLNIPGDKYLFVDEIQDIEQWEKTINSLLNKGSCDIYITGSNAHLLSSELATFISGRYIEFPIYTLSFKEFLQFRGEKKKEPLIEFQNYIRFGGLPALHHFDLIDDVVYQYLKSVYDTILLKDIIKRNNIRNVHLLEDINKYLFDNIGNIFSAKRVSDYLKSQKLNVSVDTVQNYISYLLSTFAAYKVQRYDIKGKRILEIHEKYFAGDVGIRHALLSYKETEITGVLENLVFLELKRKNYSIYIGRIGEREIDFIAEKESKRIYIQVTYLLAAAEVIEREFTPLQQIKDNYPKYVVSMDTIWGNNYEGIKRMNLMDFLLSDEI
ncbi:MAG TPA: ATP-binding protein [Candidatus Kapabacteria bacterium]|nr:ATP-binding protein [Candidatus Kapabacteria bacterium]